MGGFQDFQDFPDDVKDLYTSLPHDLIMDSLQTILIKHKEAYPDHLAILKLTEICLKSTTVKFTEEYYNQIKGTPMGSPLSTILAEIVLSTIDSWITEIKPIEILIWSRYVDDIFCIITENSENHILETLNSFNSSIQFTIEKENNGSLPFLDILFTRNRTGFTTKVYRKPTSPTQYLHFASNSPISHKITVVRTLTKRAFTHCSSKIEYNKELKSIENQLLKSGYPLPFIKRNRYKQRTPRNNSNQYISTCYLPYTESTITIARKLKSFGIKTIFRGSPSMGSILRNPITKSTDQKQKKDLVYQIPCLNCNSVYIGETSRDLSIRIKEHQRNISKLNPNSLIVDHVRETGHTPDFNNIRILHTNAKTKTQRLILEAIETMKHPKPLNKSIQLPSQPLSIRNPENTLKIKSSIKENPRITNRELSEYLDISFGTCKTIIKNDLHLKRSPAKFVPHLLTNEQKEHRKETCKNMVEMFNFDPHWLKNVVKGDEKWVYGYDPETKRQSSQWLEPGKPRFKKAKMIKSKLKCLLITFFDVKGLHQVTLVPEVPRYHRLPRPKSRQDSGRQGTSKQIDHCLYRKMEQGREEDPKEPMESDPDSESGENTTFPKKETTLGRTQEVPPSHEDATPPPPVSDVRGSLARTLYQLSSATGLSRDVELPRYNGSYEAQSFFTNYDAQADRAQLQYSTRLRKPANLLQAPLRVTNTRAEGKVELSVTYQIKESFFIPTASRRCCTYKRPASPCSPSLCEYIMRSLRFQGPIPGAPILELPLYQTSHQRGLLHPADGSGPSRLALQDRVGQGCLAILAAAKYKIYGFFVGVEMEGVELTMSSTSLRRWWRPPI
ncbi:hypothetical protein LAZ67_9000298 [Cordylochernes scorpioides]|uniref:Reverse transcriptase domain-containing protein n=1 Tax=Cordylochernes scorpioides TaxID=51811 RepID=A0ABY6KV68_9ARAC|nr:hypothetical protein LAZ67_9000298 [Cordylochernes scorpioides]